MRSQHNNDEKPVDMDATEEQLAELRSLGAEESELVGLSHADAEEWIDELRTMRRDAGQFGPSPPRGKIR